MEHPELLRVMFGSNGLATLESDSSLRPAPFALLSKTLDDLMRAGSSPRGSPTKGGVEGVDRRARFRLAGRPGGRRDSTNGDERRRLGVDPWTSRWSVCADG